MTMPIKGRHLFFGCMLLGELLLLMPLIVCALFGALQAVIDGGRRLREQLPELELPRVGRRLTRVAPSRG
jgi:hypothetical protein